MSFISETQLSNYRKRTKMFSADNIVNLNESFYRDKSRPMVFLSHKHDEQETLQGVVAFLKEEGVDVYVDWMDSSMPAYTNAETAHSLKQKIKIADKFILIATPNAINSKWCNWELGLGDAAKYKKHIALLPINKTYETFKGAEYLAIYPYIDYEDGNSKYTNGGYIQEGYYVKYRLDNRTERLIPLKRWLKAK